MDVETSDSDFFAWCLQQSPVPRNKFSRLRPDFLVISPPKTGSTWLATCLGRHPSLFVPGFKESRYFSLFSKSFDLNWYLDHFVEAGGRLKGEASPSYCLLPPGQVRLVRRLLPDVKLVFLMREPIARAWAHARHNYLYRETIFGERGAVESITDEQWRAALVHDWLLASGDYLGQLRRWLAVFPRHQLFVGFYESISREPAQLLRDVFGFLGAGAGIDPSSFPLAEKVMRGLEIPLAPNMERFLHGLLHERTVELAAFLREQFGLEPPAEWQRVLTPVPPENRWACSPTPAAFRNELDDGYLSEVLAQEEGFLSAYWGVQDDYRGYDIVFRRGKFYALSRTLGEVCLDRTDEATLADYRTEGLCFIASTLAEVREAIDQCVFERMQARLDQIEALGAEFRAGLSAAHARIEQLQAGLNAAARTLREFEAEAVALQPWVRSLAHVARAVWRRIRAPWRWLVRQATKRGAPERPSQAGERIGKLPQSVQSH